MKNRWWMAAALALAILVFASLGTDSPAQEPAPETTAEEDSEPLETFEPTEKLSAESAVSFPVDI